MLNELLIRVANEQFKVARHQQTRQTTHIAEGIFKPIGQLERKNRSFSPERSKGTHRFGAGMHFQSVGGVFHEPVALFEVENERMFEFVGRANFLQNRNESMQTTVDQRAMIRDGVDVETFAIGLFFDGRTIENAFQVDQSEILDESIELAGGIAELTDDLFDVDDRLVTLGWEGHFNGDDRTRTKVIGKVDGSKTVIAAIVR